MTFDADEGRHVHLSAGEVVDQGGSFDRAEFLSDAVVDSRFEEIAVETIMDDSMDHELTELLQHPGRGVPTRSLSPASIPRAASGVLARKPPHSSGSPT